MAKRLRSDISIEDEAFVDGPSSINNLLKSFLGEQSYDLSRKSDRFRNDAVNTFEEKKAVRLLNAQNPPCV